MFVVCALYKFVPLSDPHQFKTQLHHRMKEKDVRGTLILASEGINGTIAAEEQNVDDLLNYLNSHERLFPINYKLSYVNFNPFKRTKVKIKKEIVTMGVDGINPNKGCGTYVLPKDWNKLISDPDVLLIDTRNDYEHKLGTFKNAVNPETSSFREFPSYVENCLNPEKHKKVAMFCTGGIRCEKSTSLLKEKGFEHVYHLKGGILKYFEDVPSEETLWEGECYVFDDRVSVTQDLEKGRYEKCHACRHPITFEDKQDPKFTEGISCSNCIDRTSVAQKNRYREREKQFELAASKSKEQASESGP